VEVLVGTEVVWTNNDDAQHQVMGGKTFRSGALDTGETYRFKFSKAGTYDYLCGFHPHMTGRVVVKPYVTLTNPQPPDGERAQQDDNRKGREGGRPQVRFTATDPRIRVVVHACGGQGWGQTEDINGDHHGAGNPLFQR
jgi:hypothetical protein